MSSRFIYIILPLPCVPLVNVIILFFQLERWSRSAGVIAALAVYVERTLTMFGIKPTTHKVSVMNMGHDNKSPVAIYVSPLAVCPSVTFLVYSIEPELLGQF